MWISDRVIDLFQVNKASFEVLREALVSAQTELAAVKSELATTKANFAWATGRLNTLEFEKAALMEKAYNIKVPAVQLVTPPRPDPMSIRDFSFDDLGDNAAVKLGYDPHDVKN